MPLIDGPWHTREMRQAPARLEPQPSASRDGFDPNYSIGWPVIASFNYLTAQRRSSVRVADVQNASVVSLHSHRSTHRTAQNAAISRIAIVKLSDPLY